MQVFIRRRSTAVSCFSQWTRDTHPSELESSHSLQANLFAIKLITGHRSTSFDVELLLFYYPLLVLSKDMQSVLENI